MVDRFLLLGYSIIYSACLTVPDPTVPRLPCPHFFEYQVSLHFRYDTLTQRCRPIDVNIKILDRYSGPLELDSLNLDIELASFREIEVYSPYIRMDSLVSIESRYQPFAELDLTHCQQFSILLAYPLQRDTDFFTVFICSKL